MVSQILFHNGFNEWLWRSVSAGCINEELLVGHYNSVTWQCVSVLCLRITLAFAERCVCNEVYLRHHRWKHHVLMDSQCWDAGLFCSWTGWQKIQCPKHAFRCSCYHISLQHQTFLSYLYLCLFNYQSHNITFLKHGLHEWILAVVCIFWFMDW